MKNIYFSFIFLLTFFTLFAQERYLDSAFNVTVQSDVHYASVDAINGPYLSESYTSEQLLYLDVYTPQNDVVTSNRACIIYAHGGSFLLGSKTDAPVAKFCEEMTEKGYVVLSIEYRLGYNILSMSATERAVYRATQDMIAAVRYAKENALTLGIDPSKIFTAGNSAGSIAAILGAYLDEDERETVASTLSPPDLGCLTCSGNDYEYSAQPLATANLWGGINDTAFMGLNNNVPIISFHGTADNTVSPNAAPPYGLSTFPVLQGSSVLTERANNLGIINEYHIFEGQGHEPWGLFGNNAYFDTIVDQTTLFFYQFLEETTSVEWSYKEQEIIVFPNPVSTIFNIKIKGSPEKEVLVELYNTIGQRVYTEMHEPNSIEVNVAHLKRGMYTLFCRDKYGTYSRQILKKE